MNAVTYNFTHDYGKLLENLVYLELKKSGENISFIKNGKECEFITLKKENPQSLIQASYSLSDPDTKKREVNSLVSICNVIKKKTGLILALDDEDSITVDDIKIDIIPAYKYLVNNE